MENGFRLHVMPDNWEGGAIELTGAVPDAPQYITTAATLYSRASAQLARWRDLESSWRQMAARDYPAPGDDLEAMREKSRDWRAAAQAAMTDRAAATAATEALVADARPAIAELERIRDEFMALAQQAIDAGNAEQAREAHDSAREAQAALAMLSDSLSVVIDAAKQAAEAFRALAATGEAQNVAFEAFNAGADAESNRNILDQMFAFMGEQAKLLGALLVGLAVAAGVAAAWKVAAWALNRRKN